MANLEYSLVVESDSVSLENAVNECIAAGWEPTGGVCFYISADNEHVNDTWTQAIIRRINNG